MKRLTTIMPGIMLFLVVLLGSLTLLPRNIASSTHSALELLRYTIRVATNDHQNQSKPVAVEYFDAHSQRAGVKLQWCVFSEKDVDGFRIYRMASDESYLFVVNRNGLIPAWHQDYLDSETAPSTTYRYVLGVVFDDETEFLSQPIEAKSQKKGHALLPSAPSAVLPPR